MNHLLPTYVKSLGRRISASRQSLLPVFSTVAIEVSGNGSMPTATRRPHAAQGIECIRTAEADSARRTHRVHLSALGTARPDQNRRYRPALLRAVRAQHLARSTAAGDVWVAGSRQYRAFDEYLLPQPDWRAIREVGAVPVAIETTCTTYLDGRCDKVDHEMKKVAPFRLAADEGRRLRRPRPVLSPLEWLLATKRSCVRGHGSARHCTT
jgi:hypothetical protein